MALKLVHHPCSEVPSPSGILNVVPNLTNMVICEQINAFNRNCLV